MFFETFFDGIGRPGLFILSIFSSIIILRTLKPITAIEREIIGIIKSDKLRKDLLIIKNNSINKNYKTGSGGD